MYRGTKRISIHNYYPLNLVSQDVVESWLAFLYNIKAIKYDR